MRIEVIRPDGDLKREVWEFSFGESDPPRITLDSYSLQAKESKRHKKWLMPTHWERLFGRDNNIEAPPLPSDVENEVHLRLQEIVKSIPIVK